MDRLVNQEEFYIERFLLKLMPLLKGQNDQNLGLDNIN